MVARFKIPDGWTVQAFTFALDCTQEQAACLRRQFGGRRYSRNWAVRTLKDDLGRYRATGEETERPSLASLPACPKTGMAAGMGWGISTRVVGITLRSCSRHGA